MGRVNQNMTITLKNLHLATEQEVFDQVANHLLTQKRKSKDGGIYCKYRDSKGNKCAAGCLISDKEYDETMENISWAQLVEDRYVPHYHGVLIRDLQIVHDKEYQSRWKSALKRVAKEYKLVFKF